MAIVLKLRNKTANRVVEEIHNLIDSGKIKVWSYDKDGDFTHNSTQWSGLSWFRHYESQDGDDWDLKFGIIGNKKFDMTRALYGIYHGRFTEMLLTYFDKDISEFKITPMKDENDIF